MNIFRKFHCSLNCDQPQSFVACQWQRDKSKPNAKYLIYRWIIATYFSFVVVLSFITASECKQLDWYAIYLTNWAVILNGVTSLLAAILVTLSYKNIFTFNTDPETECRLSLALKIFWVLSTVTTVISISLCCVYWPFIYVGRDDGLNDSLTHGGNAIVNLIDLFVHAHPAYYGHVIYVFLGGASYLLFSVVYTLAGGTDRDYKNYIYSVIDWKKNTRDALIFGLSTLAFLSIMHFILTAFVALRIYVCRKYHERSEGKRNNQNIPVDNLGFNP